MPATDQATRVYRELAECYEAQKEPQMRDRFLVLAADAARTAAHDDEAERLRSRLLQFNPHHLLKPFSSFAEAMKSTDVQNYVAALRRSHPVEAAQRQLDSLRQANPSLAAPELESPSKRLGEAIEAVKVYRVQDAEQELPRRRAAAVPAELPASRPASASRPGPMRDTFGIRPDDDGLRPLRRASMELDESESRAGYWVSTSLFVLLLVACLAVTFYTFALPFLPPQWLPRPA